MWKLLVISTVLVATQAANVQNFYGQWVPMLSYPEGANSQPICVEVTFEKSSVDVACSCADGRSLTTVKVTTKKVGDDTESPRSAKLNVLAVDTAAEVEPAFAVNCGECDNRGVFRSLGDNYFIFYQKEAGHVDTEVFAKTVVSEEKLISDLEAIEDLKGKKGNIWCTSETYKQ